MHKATARYWQCYHQLPSPIQTLADKNFALLKSDMNHPSLRFKKVGKFWSVRVGRDYRALATEATHGYTWVWIGSHDAYDKLLQK